MDTIINDFNETFSALLIQIAKVLPNSLIANNKKIVLNLIKENNKAIIDTFVLYVLEYKHEIMKGDERFFMENDYSNLNNCHAYVFAFKNIWNELNKKNRNTIIKYMQILTIYTEKYTKILLEEK